jgi:hypothetical protein
MQLIAPRVLQYGLIVLTNEADTLHICTELPVSYDYAVDLSIASKFPVLVSAPAASEQHSGQDVTVAPIADGEVSKTGLGKFFALVDSASGELLTAGPLEKPQKLNGGNLFALESFTIGIPAV